MAATRKVTAEDARSLPVAVLSLKLLAELAEGTWPGRPTRRKAFLNHKATEAQQRANQASATHQILYRGEDSVAQHPEYMQALAEALGWLLSHDLLVRSAIPDARYPEHEAYIVTRLGYGLANEPQALDHVNARRRLGVDLHASIAADLEPLVAVGAFDSAAIQALRTVEETVRAKAGNPRSSNNRILVGRPLMQYAFRVGGALADPDAEEPEQQGLMELFAGAFGAIRNPLGHTSVKWSDPTAAAEVVLLADLLLRLLDGIPAVTPAGS